VNNDRNVFSALLLQHDLADGMVTGVTRSYAHFAKQFGFEPRVAFLSYSTFGNPVGERMQKVREAVNILDGRDIDFEYEGDIAADVALDPMHGLTYPFSRLTGAANVLVMPAIHSASISTKLLDSVGGATVLGPFLTGLEKPVQICSLGATASDIAQMATLAAYAPSHRDED